MTARLRRPTAVLLAVVAPAVLALAACAGNDETTSTSASRPDTPLPTEIPDGTKLVIADQSELQQNALRASGELDKLPFEYEFANFTGGPEILEAFRAGAADVATVGDTPPIHALAAGEDVPIILARQVDPRGYKLAVAPGADIPRLADLAGAKIAYAEGTAQQAIVLRALAKAGLSTSDVELVRLQLGDFPDAIRTGQVDVAPLGEPNLTRYLEEYEADGAAVIAPGETADLSTGLSYLYAPREALDDPAKAAALRAYVDHFIRSQQWINENREEWIQHYYVENQGISAEDGRRIVEANGQIVFPRLDEALVAQQQSTIDVIDEAGELPRDIQAADGFDLRFDEVVEATVAEIGASHERDGE